MCGIKTGYYGVLFAACGLLWASACTTQYDKILKSADYELKYRAAKDYYRLGKYERAAALFDQAAMFYRGTRQDDSLHFLLAKSYYLWGDIYTAEYYFEQFRNTFPRSPFVEEATLLRINCLYKQTHRYELDQTPTYKVLSAIEEFLYTFPATPYKEECLEKKEILSQRLDEKQYEAAKLYYHIENYKSATTALRTTLKDHPDSRYREEILYLLVASAYKYAENSFQYLQKDRFQAVIDEYYNFISEFPDSKYRKEVNRMNSDALKKLSPDGTSAKEETKEEQTDKK
ncbi:MAG: outer membrane protein assembly factor BamD [Prevotellaceae bacterium]|jgi:outer membrane protein assembly factor BamD|nr:outer membrane protein assembly factor BamD [Prevotellaceae bacterium]